MASAILAGDPPIEILMRRSARARRISLRVSRLDGRVTLSMPQWTGDREALAFAREKEDWIRNNLQLRPVACVPAIGGSVLFEGRHLAIVPGAVRAARLQADALVVPARADMVPARVAAFLKVTARQRLTEASQRHADALGKSFSKLTLRDTRSRWGSCSAQGQLMYSWRLVMAPPEVLDYVAAHEVAHLAQMNHSPAFWATVERLLPGYKAPRAWLRREGQLLHAYRFKD